ncbi:hypothetical protein RA280_24765 [Cupriavidus sp. CV2]|uniref:DUF6889 family protein n=1 Tax=Cupriavidus ulmosensis TaxID=3065913 RepID=UPI00296AEF6A|nr:hypothetical protein [Cupriavidus sp. CV2]MDW3684907.1 hypothetical protein [Cupriavidus sp. CV2]
MAPVMEGLCKYESLLDGTLSLEDVALMNDALAVRADNRAAARRMLEQNNG